MFHTLITLLLHVNCHFSSIVKQTISAYVNHPRIRSKNLSVLSNEVKKILVNGKQREP